MAKIFQLELFIKEMSIWKLPHMSEEFDETCVEVNVFNAKKVPICGYVFGNSSTMNRGQNFLFTLNAMPGDENRVFLNIFKKAFNRNKNFLGRAIIPIETIFSDIFSRTFADKNHTELGQEAQEQAPQGQISQEQVPQGQAPQEQTLQEQTSQEQISQEKTSQEKTSRQTSQEQTPQGQAPQGQSKENQAPIVNNNLPKNAEQNGNVEDNSSDSTEHTPIARLTKDLYPIIGVDTKQWGSVCILMRLTSFGDFSAHPIHIHQSHNEIILQNSPNTAMYKCIQLDDLKRSKRNGNERSTDVHNQQYPMNYTTDLVEIENINYNKSDYDLCPGPPASPNAADTQYEEFKAEINDNMLCVRVPKNTGIVRRIYDNDDQTSKRKMCLDNSENVYDSHIKSIPIIRGNRKYPAHYGFMSRFPSKCNENSLVYDQMEKVKNFSVQCNENRILQDDNISCPSGVEIIRRNDDPKRDVFVLKIGKELGSGTENGIQLEMKTPKNPFASRSSNVQTTSVQTYDDEFVNRSKAKKGKKGGKKSGKKK